MDLYFLRFPHGLHLSRGVADLASVEALPRSDTWTAALLSVWEHVDPAADVGALAEAPPFRVSSSLPWRGAAFEWFLPAPAGLLERAERSPWRRKLARRIRYLAPEALEWALRGVTPLDPEHLLQGGLVWPARPPEPGARPLFTIERTTRLALDRRGGGASGPDAGRGFGFARTRFDANAGIALLVECRDDDVRHGFEKALHLLAQEGLGGERSVGLGGFSVLERRRAMLPAFGRGARLLLSLTAPRREAVEAGLLDPPARYRIVERGGWVTRRGAPPLRRRTLRMLAEGSVLRPTDGDAGHAVRVLDPIPELGLPHAVFRGGPELAVDVASGEAA